MDRWLIKYFYKIKISFQPLSESNNYTFWKKGGSDLNIKNFNLFNFNHFTYFMAHFSYFKVISSFKKFSEGAKKLNLIRWEVKSECKKCYTFFEGFPLVSLQIKLFRIGVRRQILTVGQTQEIIQISLRDQLRFKFPHRY